MKAILKIIFVFSLLWFFSRTAIYLLPGDPADFLFHDSLVQIPLEELRARMDLPTRLVERVFSLPKSTSLITHQNVLKITLDALVNTLILSFLTLFFTALITTLSLLGSYLSSRFKLLIEPCFAFLSAIPLFIAGPIAIILFCIQFHLFPVSQNPLLPALTLSVHLSAFWYRIFSRQINHYRLQSAETGGRARGIDELTLFFHYLFYPCLGSMMGFIGTQIGMLLNGSVMVEIIFNWNGLGRLITDAVLSRDYPVIEMGLMVVTLLTLICQQLGYAFQRKMEPRIS